MNVDELIQRVEKTFFAKSKLCDDVVAALRLLQWHEKARRELRTMLMQDPWPRGASVGKIVDELRRLLSEQEASYPATDQYPPAAQDRQDRRWQW